jgi:hypothetical protein
MEMLKAKSGSSSSRITKLEEINQRNIVLKMGMIGLNRVFMQKLRNSGINASDAR